MPGEHNFVADDVVVHNSALVTNIAENVALNGPQAAVALFSLEMSEGELAQRFIAAQASIKGDDLRKGQVRDETLWKRVLAPPASYDRVAAVRRRLVGHRHARHPRQGAPAAPEHARPRRPRA